MKLNRCNFMYLFNMNLSISCDKIVNCSAQLHTFGKKFRLTV